jgi:hypothetical protein
MPHEPYLILLDALAQHLRGVDSAAFVQAQCLVIDGKRLDFLLERDSFDAAEDRLIVRCEVRRLPEAASEAVCRLLLQADNLWAGTRGATLGLLGDDVVLLSESARIASFDGPGLAALVAGVHRQAAAWGGKLDRATRSEVTNALPLHARA